MSDFVYDPTRADFADRALDVYRTLRDEHPVYRHPERGCFALSRYDDVQGAAADPGTFSSEGTFVGGSDLMPMIVAMDPPRHDRLRALVSRAFSPQRVTALEPRVRAIADELLDAAPTDGCDLLPTFAWQLPSRVIGELIGVPRERQAAFLTWSEAMVGFDPVGGRADVSVFANIYAEFAKLLDERRAERRGDLMSALLDAEIDGERLSQEELLGFCFVLLVAGNDTTANLIANAAVLLARHPEQRGALVADPARVPDALEEVLRYATPTQQLPRRAACDVEVHGTKIPAGSEVLLVWGAANHDDRQFDAPERFDVERRPRHLGFGYGRHFCLGANLARLEGRVALEALLSRFPHYALAGEAPWQRSYWARAHASVPVRLAP